ncbi:hypothetical protein E2C01_044948 [Portunus trituberculatus]|uniref:Uncharacterized protein n=1 Tax=Portunus trituberculatus TaxID=210409 RepID=A0A5B7G0T4_PORTR|nr:hypothetical protein [Portunus trituberculatus]
MSGLDNEVKQTSIHISGVPNRCADQVKVRSVCVVAGVMDAEILSFPRFIIFFAFPSSAYFQSAAAPLM